MILYQFLHDRSGEIVDNAFDAMGRCHFENADRARLHQRLKALYVLTSRAVKEKNLGPMIAHTESIAREHCSIGYDLRELQTAFNVLEETIWLKLLKEVPPDQVGEALGLVSTVLGAGKDTLARTYVSISSNTVVPTLNLQSLFTGIS